VSSRTLAQAGVVGLGRRGYNVCMGRRRTFALLIGISLLSTSAALGEARYTKAAAPLKVVQVATPRFLVPRYNTFGTYPQVRGGRASLIAVNDALTQAVLREQRFYAVSARKAVRTRNPYRGVFQTGVVRRFLSASTRVVSALLPVRELYPGGNDGDGWIAVTIHVPSLSESVWGSSSTIQPSLYLHSLEPGLVASPMESASSAW
jgi:hypothetical protein